MTKQPTILLIEDEEMLASMYTTKFSMEGFTIEAAKDGAEGLQKAEALMPDVILLDIIMPRLDGFAVLKELKANPKTKGIPVILLTNLGQDEDLKKGKDLGAADYFVKSNHTPQEIVEKVRTLVS